VSWSISSPTSTIQPTNTNSPGTAFWKKFGDLAMAKHPTVDEIIIEQVENADDKKGTVFNLQISEYPHVALFARGAGVTGTAHYHLGNDPSNDPQMLFVISGKMKLHFEDRTGKTREEIVSDGDLVVIPTQILHWYVTLEPSTFAEWRQTKF